MVVFKLMVINGLKSVNDAVSTVYKLAARRLTTDKDARKKDEAHVDLLPSSPTLHPKK
jgi:hypothetical protein